jgi:hypothetical protein
MTNETEITVEALEETFQVTRLQAALAFSVIELATYKPARAKAHILETYLNCFPATCKWVNACYNTPSSTEIVLHALNELLEGHGVEGLYVSDGSPLPSDFFGSYINTGDNYSGTICYLDDEGFKLSCWGDEVEKKERELAKENTETDTEEEHA